MISFDKRFNLHIPFVLMKNIADHYFMWPMEMPMKVLGKSVRETKRERGKKQLYVCGTVQALTCVDTCHFNEIIYKTFAHFTHTHHIWRLFSQIVLLYFQIATTNHFYQWIVSIAICSFENWQVYAFPVIAVWFLRLVCSASVWSPNAKHIPLIMTFKMWHFDFKYANH